MTSVLAPQGIGLWGQNLRFTGAVGVAPAIPSTAYNQNSIGQRGGTVVTPIANVTGSTPSNSSRDPFNKQAATLIIRDEPKPRTLRDGFSGGEASFERGGIVTPIARTTLTEPEIKARLGAEGKSTRPASATPISLNDAIAMLRTAEETWPSEGDPDRNPDEAKALDAGYIELVSDAKRLKIIKGASMRRPITDEEQTIVTQIASKYASALGEQSGEVVGAEAAAAAEDARPAVEAASLAAATERAGRQFDAAEDNLAQLNGAMVDAHDHVEDLARVARTVDEDYRKILNRRTRSQAEGGSISKYMNLSTVVNRLDRKRQEVGDALTTADEQLRDIGRERELAYLARNELGDQVDVLAGARVEPSRLAQMRDESNARFAPHDRERRRQADMMRSVMDPQFDASRIQAGNIANAVRGDMGAIARDQMDQAGNLANAVRGDMGNIARAQLGRLDALSGSIEGGFTRVNDSVYREALSTRGLVDSSARVTAESINEQRMAIQDEIANLNDMLVATVEDQGRKGRKVTSSEAAAISNRINNLTKLEADARSRLIEISGSVASSRHAIEGSLSAADGRMFAMNKRAIQAATLAEKRAAEAEARSFAQTSSLRAYQDIMADATDEQLRGLSEQLIGMDTRQAAMEGRMATRYLDEQKIMREELISPMTQMGSRIGAMGDDVAAIRGGVESVVTGISGVPLRMVYTESGRSSGSAGPTLAAGLRASNTFRAPTSGERENMTAAERRALGI